MRKVVTSTALLGSLILLAPAPALAATLVPMDQDGVNVRSGPGQNYSVISGIPWGSSATVLSREGEWYKVQLANGTVGYVAGWVSHVRYDDENQTGVVTTDVLNVRSAPSLSASILGTVKNGQQFRVLEVRPDWWQIEYNGRSAWVAAQYVSLVEDTTSGEPTSSDSEETSEVEDSEEDASLVQVRSITREIQGNSVVYRFETTATVTPSTADGGDYVTVTIPGSRLAATLPAGMTSTQDGDTLIIRVSSGMAYSLKPISGGFELHLYPSIGGRTIVIDPGHGGPDPGAVNRNLGLQEKDITLNVALKLRDYLEAKGANVLLTREGDVNANYPQPYTERADLAARSAISNNNAADLFLAVHLNSVSSPSATGTETYYCSYNYNSERSKYLATLVQQAVVDSLGHLDRGVKDYDFYVVTYTNAPAALAELAFISNDQEAKLLADSAVQDTVAANLADAIEAFFTPRNTTVPGSISQETPETPGTELTPYDLAYYAAAIRAEKARGQYQPLDTFVNGQKIQFDVRPRLMNSRTMVPVRSIAEALGAEVIWSEAAPNNVRIVKGDTTIDLVVGKTKATVNGKTVQLDAAPTLVADSRVLVPIRFVSEELGMKVAWFGDDQVIAITDQPIQGYDYGE